MSAHFIPMVPGKITVASTVDLSRVVVRQAHPPWQLPTFENIKAAVAKSFDTTIPKIDSRKRSARIVLARHVAMHLCRDVLNATTTEVAERFHRVHTTVMDASEHIQNLMETEPRMREKIQRLQAQVRGL